MDDTLAVTKSPISADIAVMLGHLADKYELCIITGGGFKQIEQCVLEVLGPLNFDMNKLHLLPLSGAVYYHFDGSRDGWLQQAFVTPMDDSAKANVSRAIEVTARQLGLWETKTAGAIIEDRSTQITFSALGQQASPDDKYGWDPDRSKRLRLQRALATALPDYEVRINGNTSIDVTQQGMDKGHGMQRLIEVLGLSLSDVLFIGDELGEQGNDYPIKALGIECKQVHSPAQTEALIKGLITVG